MIDLGLAVHEQKGRIENPNNLFGFCGRCATPRFWLSVALARPSVRRTPTTEGRSLLNYAR
jgi:hypothetical protein